MMIKNRYFKVGLALMILFSLAGTSFWFGLAYNSDEEVMIEQNLKENEQEVIDLDQVILESEKEIERLKQDLQQSKKQIGDLEQETSHLEELAEEKKELKIRLAEKKVEITSLEELNKKQLKKIDELKSQSSEESSTDSKGSESNQSANIPKPDESKKVFLTFDDGPTARTPDILDTLKEYDVNATFFTVGQRMESLPEITRRTYEEGNMLLTHSYTHDYAIYGSFDKFYEDLQLAERAYKDVLGIDAPKIIRFPGGSSNHSSFDYGGKQFMPRLTQDFKERGYHYIDWNVSSGDAGALFDQPQAMLEYIKDSSQGKDLIVTLFHDTVPNQVTADILPDVIKFYKDNGYQFRTFRDISDKELNEMIKTLLADKPIVR